jgi:hypothetical protein
MDGNYNSTISIDEFAQTRGVDDLFEDEIVPISVELQEYDNTLNDGYRSEENDAVPRWPPADDQGSGHNEEINEGWGVGWEGQEEDRGRKSESNEHVAEQTVEAYNNDYRGQPVEESEEDPARDVSGTPSRPSDTPNKAETPRVQAVRGDRSSTGGIKKPKLSEEELIQRMAAAKLTAAKIAAAHARAEADEASFHEREKLDREKLAEEKACQEDLIRDMDGERERNRLRKLGTQTGREWDAEKREEDYSNDHPGGGPYRRGMHGAVTGYSRRGNENDDSANDGFDYVGRGQGGRGWRGGRESSGRIESFTRNEDPDPAATDAFPDPDPDPGTGDDDKFLALPNADSTTASGSASNVNDFTYDSGNFTSPISPW